MYWDFPILARCVLFFTAFFHGDALFIVIRFDFESPFHLPKNSSLSSASYSDLDR